MSARHAITDANWDRIKDLLPGRPGQPGWTAADNRRFVDAVLWIGKTGVPWRDLPERFGTWNSVWKRFDRWSRKGTWRAVFDALQDPDPEWLVLDATVIRAHPHAAGARKNPDGTGQALGRSRGGFGTTIHGAVTGLGLPAEILLTPGQDADVTQADAPLAGKEPAVVIADKGYDKQALVDAIEAAGAEAVIPTRKNSTAPRRVDPAKYRDRNLVERFWAKAKPYRRVATRYEKTARNFLGMVLVASIMVLLK